jgi:hypothetical protein
MDSLIKEVVEIRLHPRNFNMDTGEWVILVPCDWYDQAMQEYTNQEKRSSQTKDDLYP